MKHDMPGIEPHPFTLECFLHTLLVDDEVPLHSYETGHISLFERHPLTRTAKKCKAPYLINLKRDNTVLTVHAALSTAYF